MYLVKINKNQEIVISQTIISLTNKIEGIELDYHKQADYQITPFNDIDKKSQFVFLTLDNTIEDLQNLPNTIKSIFFYITDFKDGRIFSLIRQLKKSSFIGDIIILGEFGVDQAAYFYKIGVTGFLVDDNKLEILTHTLSDLKTAHQGTSASSLPIFR